MEHRVELCGQLAPVKKVNTDVACGIDEDENQGRGDA
jgi:hypothetical protein